jgi:hypothetical protein
MEQGRTSEATEAGFRFQHTHKPSRSVSQRRPELVCALRYAKVEPERVQSSGTEFGVSGSDSEARLQVKIRSKLTKDSIFLCFLTILVKDLLIHFPN